MSMSKTDFKNWNELRNFVCVLALLLTNNIPFNFVAKYALAMDKTTIYTLSVGKIMGGGPKIMER